MISRTLGTALLVTLIPTAGSAQAGRVEHLKHGDTTIVRTSGNGTWGAPKDAVELKRVGSEAKETTFGRISSIAALPSGAVALFDARALDGPIVRLFDRDGHFVRNIGRIGSGPGEYRADLITVTATPAGEWLVSDPMNARANYYAPDGQYRRAVRIAISNFAGVDMVRAGLHDDVYVRNQKTTIGPPMTMSEGFLHLDSTGRVLDTVPLFAVSMTTPFTAAFLPILPDGRRILFATDRVAFAIRSPRDINHPLLVELDLQPAKYLAPERVELENATRVAPTRGGGAPVRVGGPPIGEFKQPFADIRLDGQNRVWLHRHVISEKGAPTESPNGTIHTYHEAVVYDAFQTDGTFLGEVRFPAGVHIEAFAGDIAWGWLIGDDDQIYLVKYRAH